MKNLLNLFSVVLILISICSCNKSHVHLPDDSNEGQQSIANEWDDNPYKLNVVYFVPTDLDTLANYRLRMDTILSEIQEFYATNMDREGYGRLSFGLDQVDGLLNVTVIRAAHDKAYYVTPDGGSKLTAEINAYFSANPTLKKSDHYIAFLPKYNPGESETVQPFYGLGRFCFVVDYPELGTTNFRAGGIAHELGHALNLPHDGETKSEKAALGVSIMGYGLDEYANGQSSFLTAASCAILSRTQVFSTITRPDWYTGQSLALTNGKTELANNILTISGRFDASMEVVKVIAYHDKGPATGNPDYDAITFTSNIIGTDSFKIVCPLNDFYNTTDTTQLRLRFVFDNGANAVKRATYTFASNQPVINNIFPAPIMSGFNYRLVSFVNNTSVLDVDGGGTADGARAVLWGPITPTPNNQLWKVTNVGNGYYKLEPLHALTKALEVAGGSDVNRTPVQIGAYNGSDGQRWKIQPELGGGYELIPACAPLSRMDIAAGSSANGARMQLFQSNGNNAQKWRFVQQ